MPPRSGCGRIGSKRSLKPRPSLKSLPSKFSGWPAISMFMIWIVSRMRVTAGLNGTPWKCSITCGPLVPKPATARPSEISSRVAKCCASAAGVRE